MNFPEGAVRRMEPPRAQKTKQRGTKVSGKEPESKNPVRLCGTAGHYRTANRGMMGMWISGWRTSPSTWVERQAKARDASNHGRGSASPEVNEGFAASAVRGGFSPRRVFLAHFHPPLGKRRCWALAHTVAFLLILMQTIHAEGLAKAFG